MFGLHIFPHTALRHTTAVATFRLVRRLRGCCCATETLPFDAILRVAWPAHSYSLTVHPCAHACALASAALLPAGGGQNAWTRTGPPPQQCRATATLYANTIGRYALPHRPPFAMLLHNRTQTVCSLGIGRATPPLYTPTPRTNKTKQWADFGVVEPAAAPSNDFAHTHGRNLASCAWQFGRPASPPPSLPGACAPQHERRKQRRTQPAVPPTTGRAALRACLYYAHATTHVAHATHIPN